MMKKEIMISLSSLLVTANTWSEEYYEFYNDQQDAYQEIGYQPQTYPLADDDDEKTYKGVNYRIESEEFQAVDDDVEGLEYQDTYDEVDFDDFQPTIPETAVYQDESYLEGISVIGREKTAYLSIKGSKIPVKEGEKFTFSRDSGLGTWQVVRIKKDSVVLKAQGRDLEEELHLHTRLPLSERGEKSHFQETTEANENTDDENPTMYRLVRTPFGHFVVRDDAPMTQTSAPKTDKSSNSNTTVTQSHEEVPPGHRVVRTPFGNFIAKDEK
jgi:hypothetical protein